MDLSVVVAVYMDGQAVHEMYERVCQSLEEKQISFELIFVNDSSPDHARAEIRRICEVDARVRAIEHTRNFGSQAAFISGMETANGAFVALLDGDLQDPPELLPRMLEIARMGTPIVYGDREERDGKWLSAAVARLYYRIFSWASPFQIPRNAGDFSVMRKDVARALTTMPERNLFLRAQRAYLGFESVGVPYTRPVRKYGSSTNSLPRNFGWATLGLLSVSKAPLNLMAALSALFSVVSMILILVQVGIRLARPDLAPEGLTTIILLVLLVGSVLSMGISIVGLYVGSILDEVRARPRFVRLTEGDPFSPKPKDKK